MEQKDERKSAFNNNNKRNTPVGLIILSGFSFVPAIGIFFGLVSIAISLFNFKRFRPLFILGLSGIIFSVVIYSTIYYLGTVKRGGTFDEMRITMNHFLLKQIDKEMINYKCRFGSYPTKLTDILKVNGNLNLKDPIIEVIKNYKGDSLFYYESTSDSFLLFSVGFDGKPFTPDDIHFYDVDSLITEK